MNQLDEYNQIWDRYKNSKETQYYLITRNQAAKYLLYNNDKVVSYIVPNSDGEFISYFSGDRFEATDLPGISSCLFNFDTNKKLSCIFKIN